MLYVHRSLKVPVPQFDNHSLTLFYSSRGRQMLLSISLLRRTSFPVGSGPELRIWILRVGRSTPTARLPPPRCKPAHSAVGFSRRRPVAFFFPTLPLLQFDRNLVSLSFQWPSVAWFAFSSAIVNECRMRPQSSRPLQYEDGVGGSQRGAPSSGTNTGNRRAGKCRHGKTPGAQETQKLRGCLVSLFFLPVASGKRGRNAVRIYFAQAREATAVASGSLATVSGEKTRGFVVVSGW